ncbi:hypothetical protein GCAAIG_08705 [Candidatus Electronema halotolerans]
MTLSLRVSEIACELPLVKELDINPLIVDEHGAMAVDARIVVDFHAMTSDRYSHMAIYPYPAHFVTKRQLPNGMDMVIRPIRPEDADMEQEFVRNLSEQSKYFRFMQAIDELSPQMLARYSINPDGRSCEFAIVVADEWQRQGIAHLLMQQLLAAARSHGLQLMEGDVLSTNNDMLTLAAKLGFNISTSGEDPDVVHVVLRL